jgi:hypothetical protein
VIRRRIVSAGVLALGVVLLGGTAALGDADPASDVLLGSNVFYPYSPPVSASRQARLNAEVAVAHRAHFPLKVALVATPADLGALPTFFGKPQQYAAFLDQEISFVNFGNQKAPLLVVMRAGYGAAGLAPPATAAVASLPKPATGSSDALAQAAIAAVFKLAVASGHRLSVAPGSSPTGGSSSPVVPVIALCAACLLLAAGIVTWRRRRPARPR